HGPGETDDPGPHRRPGGLLAARQSGVGAGHLRAVCAPRASLAHGMSAFGNLTADGPGAVGGAPDGAAEPGALRPGTPGGGRWGTGRPAGARRIRATVVPGAGRRAGSSAPRAGEPACGGNCGRALVRVSQLPGCFIIEVSMDQCTAPPDSALRPLLAFPGRCIIMHHSWKSR